MSAQFITMTVEGKTKMIPLSSIAHIGWDKERTGMYIELLNGERIPVPDRNHAAIVELMRRESLIEITDPTLTY